MMMKIKEWNLTKLKHPKVRIVFYDLVKAISRKHWYELEHSQTNPNWCSGFGRLFHSMILTTVEKVIDFPADAVMTGNIGSLWSEFAKMSDTQMIGIARSPASKKDFSSYVFTPSFDHDGKRIGIMLMNLKKMSESGWELKISQTFKFYYLYGIDINRSDGYLLNLLLSLNSDMLRPLSCHLLFLDTDCDPKTICGDVKDGLEVQAILFEEQKECDKLNHPFHEVYEHYAKFNLERGNVMKDLVLHLRNYASAHSDNICYRILSKQLFRTQLKDRSVA